MGDIGSDVGATISFLWLRADRQVLWLTYLLIGPEASESQQTDHEICDDGEDTERYQTQQREVAEDFCEEIRRNSVEAIRTFVSVSAHKSVNFLFALYWVIVSV